MIEPEPLQQVDRTYVRLRGRRLSYFSGCDYFRLASHPLVLKAATRALERFGLNVSASRFTTGNHPLYRELERHVALFFDAEDALLVPTGYLAAQTVAQTLAGKFSHALIDERSHGALQDAVLLVDCPVLRFSHRNVDGFRAALNRCGPGARLVALTDGMFAFDGSIAPLKLYLKWLPKDGLLIVDDAHGAGVVGKTGKGSVEIERVSRSRVIQCIALSKAFGAYGGAVVGSRRLRESICSRSRTLIGSTPTPLPLIAAALTSIKLLRTNAGLRRRLDGNTIRVKSALRAGGYALPENHSPIVPLVLSTPAEIQSLKRSLLASGIYPPLLRYPGSPAGGYFRFVISSEHSTAQLDGLITALLEHRLSYRRSRPA